MDLQNQKWQRQHRLMSHRRVAIALFLVAVGLSAAIWPSSASGTMPAADEWIIECVDCPRYYEHLAPRAMQADSEGTLHVVYGAEHLYHAWGEEGDWQSEVVDDRVRVGREATLAIDQDDGLHVVYFDEGAQTLSYAFRGPDGWQIEEIVGGVRAKAYPTIAVGPAGLIHLAYYHAGDENLVYAYLDGDAWPSEVVAEDGAGRGASLAISDDGSPHLSYICDGLCYAAKEITGWRHEIVASALRGTRVAREYDENSDRYYTSLALDAEGTPHIAHTSYHGVEYSIRSVDGWRMDVINPQHHYSLGSFNCSLVLDQYGEPHISYVSAFHGPKGPSWLEAFYTTHSDGQWSTVELGFGSTPILFWRRSDGPHIVYQAHSYQGRALWGSSVGGRALHHTFQEEMGWQTEIIEQGGDAGSYAALALDPSGHARVVSFDEPNSLVRYAQGEGKDWLIEPLGDLFEPRITHAPLDIAVDRRGVPHVVAEAGSALYYDYNDMGYAYRDDTGWHGKSDYFGPADIRGHSIALDSLDLPRVSMGAGGWTHCYLYYHYLDASSGWTLEEIMLSSDKCVGNYTDLAIDRADAPHIAYVVGSSYTDHDLKYAYKDAVGWHFDTVDSRGDVGQYVSLALDGADHPRMSYYDATNGDLVYAEWNGDDWRIELVEREGDVGLYTSLAIDWEDHAHISYYDATNGNLKYAYQDETGWQIQTVDDNGDVGQYSSLALYGRYPTIAYYDQWRHDLKVARLPFLPTDFQYLPLLSSGGVN